VRLLIQDDSEAQLALFLSKTLTNAIMMYRQVLIDYNLFTLVS
jgi:hypothetical protein